MKRHWPLLLFACCWLAVLLAAPLRLSFMAQTFRPAPPYRGLGYGPSWMNPGEQSVLPLPASFSDVAVQAIALEEAKGADGYNRSDKLIAADYGALLSKNPHLMWLRARQLFYLRRAMKSGRLAGELDDVNWRKHRVQGVASPERAQEPPNFTPREWQSAVAAAREAASREADNAFWLWCLTEFLLHGGRDREARAALRAAATAPRFEWYEREFQVARLHAEAARYGRALLPEEKLHLAAEPSLSSGEQSTARLLAWQALKAERRGDHHAALDIELNLARLGLLSARDAYWDLQRHRGQSIVVIALRSRQRVNLPPAVFRKLTPWQSAQRNVSAFMPYVRARGTAEQMASARAVATRYVALARAIENSRKQRVNNYGYLKSAVFTQRLTLFWAASATLWLLILALPLWLFLKALRRAVRAPDVEIDVRDRVSTAALGVAVLLALCAAVPSHLGWNYYPWAMLMPVKQPAAAYLVYANALLWTAPFIALLTLHFWCAAATAWRVSRAAKAAGSAPLTLGDWLSFGWSLILLLPAAGAVAWWLSIANYGTGPYMGELDAYDWRRWHPLWPLAAFGFALALAWVRLLFGAAHSRSFLFYRLRWLQSALGALIVTAGVFYLAFNMVAFPLRKPADAEVQRLVQRGEVALMNAKFGG